MQSKKYNEFKVTGRVVKGKFEIDQKIPTKRGHVMISERDADINNQQTRFNKLYYELAETQPTEKKAGRPPKNSN